MTTNMERAHDRDLKDAVEMALEWAPEVDAAQIGVAVRDGVVTLSGQVGSYWQKVKAGDTALRAHGVTALANDILVHYVTDPRTDAEIALAAHNILNWVAGIPTDFIKVAVEDHVVTLTGEVGWNYQRETAARLVEQLIGVKDVDNRITLKPRPCGRVPETETLIRQALIRNASIDAERIHVSVDRTRVVLTGTVSSHAEKCQAEHAAWSSAHVDHVDNQLRIGT